MRRDIKLDGLILRVHFIASIAFSNLGMTLGELYINTHAVSMACEHPRQGGGVAPAILDIQIESMSQVLGAEDCKKILAEASKALSSRVDNLHEAIGSALHNSDLFKGYAGWNEALLSDFTLECEVTASRTGSLWQVEIKDGSMVFSMEKPEEHETSRLPFNDPQALPAALIDWVKEVAGL